MLLFYLVTLLYASNSLIMKSADKVLAVNNISISTRNQQKLKAMSTRNQQKLKVLADVSMRSTNQQKVKTDATSSCDDFAGWTDSYGDSCVWYVRWMANPCLGSERYQNNGVWASQACCHCGGGHQTPTAAPTESTTEVLLHNAFHEHYPGNRNNHNGETGYEIEVLQPINVVALGRSIYSGNKMIQSSTVTIWDVETQQKIAFIDVGPTSLTRDGYAYAMLPESVQLQPSKKYRLSQTCTAGMPDQWNNNRRNLMADEYESSLFNFIQGVWSSGGYPKHDNHDVRWVAIVTFFFQDLDCFTEGSKYLPLNMQGQGRSVENDAEACQSRCSRVAGCSYFSYWADGSRGCHLQSSSASKIDAPAAVISGPKSCSEGATTPVPTLAPTKSPTTRSPTTRSPTTRSPTTRSPTTLAPTTKPPTPSPDLSTSYTYIGCFVDDGSRDMHDNVGSGYNQESCSSACTTRYFALQYHGQCFCGDTYGTLPQYSQVADSECGSDKLGLGWRNAIYERDNHNYNNNVHGGTVYIPWLDSEYSTSCNSAADIETVRARCEIWKDQYIDTPRFIDNCIETYCQSVIPNPENTDAMAIPSNPSDCESNNCVHYRLGWGLGASWYQTVPKAVKITGTKHTTKWILIPYIGYEIKNELRQQMSGLDKEYMETDLYIPDLGEITNVTVYLDTDGTYSSLTQWTHRFIPRTIRILDPNQDTVTDVGYKWQYQGPQFCNDNPPQCNLVVPVTLVTHNKWYDLVGTQPRCIERGLCPDKDKWNGYGLTVPSWRERKEFAMTNAARNSAKNFISRYTDGTREFACNPNNPFENRPYYYSIDATEGCRLKAWDMGLNKCPDAVLSPHFTCDSTVERFGLAGNGFGKRIEAFTSEICLNHCGSSELLDRPHIYTLPPGIMVFTTAGAAEGIGGDALAQILSDPGHCGGLMNHERSMAAIGFHPIDSSWDISTPMAMSGYAGGVFDYFDDGDWAIQPWNNRKFGTYQPIPSGSHFKHTEGENEVVRFMTQYYDYDQKVVQKMELVLDGTAKQMVLTLGKAWQGTYEYDMPLSYFGEECHSFYFRAINSRGIFTLPQSGKFQYRTFGIGTCLEDFTSSSCQVTEGPNACKSTCGFPGKRCET